MSLRSNHVINDRNVFSVKINNIVCTYNIDFIINGHIHYFYIMTIKNIYLIHSPFENEICEEDIFLYEIDAVAIDSIHFSERKRVLGSN